MDKTCVLTWFGFVFSVTGTLMSFSWNSVFDFIVKTEVAISPTSTSYVKWKKSTVSFNFYTFNWTNPEKVLEKNYIPHFVELGPYAFKEVYEKVNVTWNANHTVTYKRSRSWYFDPENSKGNLSDKITTVNIVAVTSSFTSRFWGFLSTYALSTTLRLLGQNVWVQTTVRELVFDGYHDPVHKMTHTAAPLFGAKVEGDRVAVFLNRNGSATFDGVFNVETGAEDIRKTGLLRSWNYKTKYDSFEGECSKLRGSIGDLFPGARPKNESVTMFTSDFCRSMNFDYMEETEVRGIPVYKYEATRFVVDNGTMDPLTQCNCAGQCLPAGVINVSTCCNGMPVFFSLPHFYNADPYYLRQLKGLKPDPNRHSSELTLEPNTGIPVYFNARVQMNLLLQPNNGINMFRDAPTIMFPIIWVEDLISLEPTDVLLVRILLLLPVVGPYISLGVAFIGLTMMAVSILPKILDKHKHKLQQCIEGKPSERIASQVALPVNRTKGPIPGEKHGVKPHEESSLLNTQMDNLLMD